MACVDADDAPVGVVHDHRRVASGRRLEQLAHRLADRSRAPSGTPASQSWKRSARRSRTAQASSISLRGDHERADALGEPRPRTPRRPRCRGRRACRGRTPPCRAPSPSTRDRGGEQPDDRVVGEVLAQLGPEPGAEPVLGHVRDRARPRRRSSTGASSAPMRGGAGAGDAERRRRRTRRGRRGRWSSAARSMVPSGRVTATRQRSPSTSRPRRAANAVSAGMLISGSPAIASRSCEHARRGRRRRGVGAAPARHGLAQHRLARRDELVDRRVRDLVPRARRGRPRAHPTAPIGTRSDSARRGAPRPP